jgi:hypothetical protein
MPMTARYAGATNPLAPVTTSVIPPRKTQAAVPDETTHSIADVRKQAVVVRMPVSNWAMAQLQVRQLWLRRAVRRLESSRATARS